MKKNILFVCIHNSARSQMAEAFANHLCGDRIEAYSAGIEGGKLNPLVVRAMAEAGIDISQNATKTTEDPAIRARRYDYVVTVCDEASAERCPLFSGEGIRMHWGFEDPSGLTGSEAEILDRVRTIRDGIREKVREWCAATPLG